LRTLKAERSQRSIVGRMQTRSELYKLLGYQASPSAPPPAS